MSSALCQRYQQFQVDHNLQAAQFSSAATDIIEQLEQAGFDAFLVGGCLRDAFAGLKPKDFDIATNATPEQVVKSLPKARIIGRRFKIVHVRRGREIYEVTTFRGHDKVASKSDRSGRLLRDNSYGNVKEDAERRDFTINALYYHPGSNTVLDFVGAYPDISRKLIKVIGEPSQRYREDPVRMIRALRFAAKLGFKLDTDAASAIKTCASALADVPAARLFDEVLKLLMAGHAVKTFELLQEYGLFKYLFPASAIELNEAQMQAFIVQALENTDARIKSGKYVTPAYLYACLIWPARQQLYTQLISNGTTANDANQLASAAALDNQVQHTAIPKRFSIPMREIWGLQTRLERMLPRQVDSILSHARFRAAYDFLLLRNSVGEDLQKQCDWWTEIQEKNQQEQAEAVKQLPDHRPRQSRRRRRRHG